MSGIAAYFGFTQKKCRQNVYDCHVIVVNRTNEGSASCKNPLKSPYYETPKIVTVARTIRVINSFILTYSFIHWFVYSNLNSFFLSVTVLLTAECHTILTTLVESFWTCFYANSIICPDHMFKKYYWLFWWGVIKFIEKYCWPLILWFLKNKLFLLDSKSILDIDRCLVTFVGSFVEKSCQDLI